MEAGSLIQNAAYRCLVKLPAANKALFKHFHFHHLDTGVADAEDIELVVVDDDPVLLLGDGLMVVNDVTGEGFGIIIRELKPVFFRNIIQFQPA
jgi:hypothetical protein